MKFIPFGTKPTSNRTAPLCQSIQRSRIGTQRVGWSYLLGPNNVQLVRRCIELSVITVCWNSSSCDILPLATCFQVMNANDKRDGSSAASLIHLQVLLDPYGTGRKERCQVTFPIALRPHEHRRCELQTHDRGPLTRIVKQLPVARSSLRISQVVSRLTKRRSANVIRGATTTSSLLPISEEQK